MEVLKRSISLIVCLVIVAGGRSSEATETSYDRNVVPTDKNADSFTGGPLFVAGPQREEQNTFSGLGLQPRGLFGSLSFGKKGKKDQKYLDSPLAKAFVDRASDKIETPTKSKKSVTGFDVKPPLKTFASIGRNSRSSSSTKTISLGSKKS